MILRTLATLALLPITVNSASSPEEIEKQLLSYLGMVRRPRAPSIEVPDYVDRPANFAFQNLNLAVD